MDLKIHKSILYINAVVIAFFAMFSGDIYAAIINNTSLDKDMARPVILLFAILFVLFSEFSVKYLVTKSKFIRHRFIRGRDFIEGFWFDVVIVPSTKTIRECGLIEISYENDEYVLSGTLFDTKARRIGGFTSRLSKFGGKEIEFAYLRTAEHDVLEEEFGYSTYKFTRSQPYSIAFTGSFFDSALEERLHVKGERISDRKFIKRLVTNDKNDEQDTAYQLLTEFIKENNGYTLAHENKI